MNSDRVNVLHGNKVPREQIEIQNDLLRTKHIRTLEVLEHTQNEARNLAIRCEQLECQLLSCKELHDLARNTKTIIENTKKTLRIKLLRKFMNLRKLKSRR